MPSVNCSTYEANIGHKGGQLGGDNLSDPHSHSLFLCEWAFWSVFKQPKNTKKGKIVSIVLLLIRDKGILPETHKNTQRHQVTHT